MFSEQTQTVRLQWTLSDRHRHVRAFFHSAEEEYTLMLPSSTKGSSSATRSGTSSIPNSAPSIWGFWVKGPALRAFREGCWCRRMPAPKKSSFYGAVCAICWR